AVARSGYAGCHHDSEAPIDRNNHGLLFLDSQVRFGDIYDGSTNTLLIGEALTSPDELGWVSGTRATLRNTSVIDEPRPYLATSPAAASGDAREQRPNSLFVGGFGSHHPGGLNAAFADGSTRFVSNSIDPDVLRRLGNRADGEILEPF
ncbi:MAG: DUF1559 domain-containing protein, partial [Planctomycetes bacterium]|nr:DUF1559 domain-containing protein [Planctomycetota bacterium]